MCGPGSQASGDLEQRAWRAAEAECDRRAIASTGKRPTWGLPGDACRPGQCLLPSPPRPDMVRVAGVHGSCADIAIGAAGAVPGRACISVAAPPVLLPSRSPQGKTQASKHCVYESTWEGGATPPLPRNCKAQLRPAATQVTVRLRPRGKTAARGAPSQETGSCTCDLTSRCSEGNRESIAHP